MATMSVDLSITMTAAVPNPDCTSFRASKSILSLGQQRPSVQYGFANMFWKDGHRSAAWNNAEEIVPSTTDAATMPFNQIL